MRLSWVVAASVGFGFSAPGFGDASKAGEQATAKNSTQIAQPSFLTETQLVAALNAAERPGLDVVKATKFDANHPILSAAAKLPEKSVYKIDTLLPYRESSFDKPTLSINPGALQHASLLTTDGPQFLLRYTNNTAEGPSWYAYATSQYRIAQTTLIPNPKNPGAYVAVMQLMPEGEQPKPDANGIVTRATPTDAMDAVGKKTGGKVWSYFNSLASYQANFTFDQSQPPEIMNDLVTLDDRTTELGVEIAYPKDFTKMLATVPRTAFGNGVVVSNIRFHDVQGVNFAIADAQPVATAKDSLALQLRQAYSYAATVDGAVTVNIGEQQVSSSNGGESAVGAFWIKPEARDAKGPDLRSLRQAQETRKTIGAR